MICGGSGCSGDRCDQWWCGCVVFHKQGEEEREEGGGRIKSNI